MAAPGIVLLCVGARRMAPPGGNGQGWIEPLGLKATTVLEAQLQRELNHAG